MDTSNLSWDQDMSWDDYYEPIDGIPDADIAREVRRMADLDDGIVWGDDR